MKNTAARRLRASASLAALALASALAAQAQTSTVPATAQSPMPAPAPSPAPGPGPDTSAARSPSANVSEFRALRMGRLIGLDVRTPKGEPVGKVHDLIVDASNARVRYVVMAFEPGVLPGERLAPVPVGQFGMGPQRNSLVYKPRPATLEKVALEKAQWSDAWLREPARLAQLDRAWGLDQRTGKRPVRRGSTLLGQPVVGPDGAGIGRIEEVVVHLNQQKVNYAILRVDAAQAGQDKRLAVPMALFKRPADGGAAFVLDVRKDKLQALPGLGMAQQQNPNERAFVADINRHLAAFGTPGAPPPPR